METIEKYIYIWIFYRREIKVFKFLSENFTVSFIVETKWNFETLLQIISFPIRQFQEYRAMVREVTFNDTRFKQTYLVQPEMVDQGRGLMVWRRESSWFVNTWKKSKWMKQVYQIRSIGIFVQ